MYKYLNAKKEPLIDSSYFSEMLSAQECEKLKSLHPEVIRTLWDRREELQGCLFFHRNLLDVLLKLTPQNIHLFFDKSTFGYTDHPERLLNELFYNAQGGVSYNGSTVRFNFSLPSFNFFGSSVSAPSSNPPDDNQPYKLFG